MLGRSLIVLAMGFCAFAAPAAIASQRRIDGRWTVVRPELLTGARRAMVAAALALVGAAVTLEYALLSHDFSISYVAEHTSRATPPWYTFSAFWSGMGGSMLMWCLILSLYAAVFVGRRRP